MIIESIELEHVGPFRNKASIGPLRAGINVLAAPNETGKSTFVRAAARALAGAPPDFDVHHRRSHLVRRADDRPGVCVEQRVIPAPS